MTISSISRSRSNNKHKIIEKLQAKYQKAIADLKHIKTCKKESLIPTFVKVNFSMKNKAYKLRRKISLLVMNTELENKQSEKRKLQKEIKKMYMKMKRNLDLIVLSTVLQSNSCCH